MKISQHIISLVFYSFFLIVNTCAKDDEEAYDENVMEVTYGKNDHVTKEMAIENWELFFKQSQKLISITETNIASIQVKIETANESEKTELQKIYNTSRSKLLKIKTARLKRNSEFSTEIKNYNEYIQPKNEKFKKQFKQNIISINTTLENYIERNK
ncbi:hypothetical protein [Flavobacterium sp.]|uniref:hypothetical protein n=1 Tax=Flavobacterium sp. TaxID=239 RepID=UPI003D6B7BE7